MTRYAPIDIMWWDYSQGAMEGARGWKAPELMDMVRSINPGVIMNNRLYAYSGLNRDQAGTLDLRCGDYITPERFIPRRGYPGVDWESCMTVSDKWGYNRYDTNIKSPETVIEKLVECVTKGGNLLLNVNPMADGTVPEKVAATMRGVGQWLKINGEAVYGTRAFTELDQPASINRQGDIFRLPGSAAGQGTGPASQRRDHEGTDGRRGIRPHAAAGFHRIRGRGRNLRLPPRRLLQSGAAGRQHRPARRQRNGSVQGARTLQNALFRHQTEQIALFSTHFPYGGRPFFPGGRQAAVTAGKG